MSRSVKSDWSNCPEVILNASSNSGLRPYSSWLISLSTRPLASLLINSLVWLLLLTLPLSFFWELSITSWTWRLTSNLLDLCEDFTPSVSRRLLLRSYSFLSVLAFGSNCWIELSKSSFEPSTPGFSSGDLLPGDFYSGDFFSSFSGEDELDFAASF